MPVHRYFTEHAPQAPITKFPGLPRAEGEKLNAAVLSLSGFGVCFGRKVILSNIDLELPATGIDVLMGPVKSGKSTLMRSLSGLHQTSTLYRSWGSATLFGKDVGSECLPILVQQHATILNLSLQDALLAPTREQKKRPQMSWQDFAVHCLECFALEHLQPCLSDPVLSLAPEWQRAINILSHALTTPKLLMIDEPTYGLDELAAGRLIEWLSKLGKSINLLVSLHHQGQARRLADRIILLGGGRILAHEPTQVFFHRCPNHWVEQFVRTGSLPIASPGASRDDLQQSAEQPPPLPPEALAAIAEFKEEPAITRQMESKTHLPRLEMTAAPLPESQEEKRMPQPTRARLPDTSPQGVEVASAVGSAAISEYRGPNGFRWIIPNKLAGCPKPGVSSSIDYDLELLRGVGVTHLLTLTEENLDQSALQRHGLKNLHISIIDREAPSIRQAYMVVYRMQAILNEGGILAVHCHAGIGRTGTMLAAWLIREGGLTASGAIQRLRKINPAYVQSEVQEIFLQDFEQDLTLRL